MMIIRKAKNEEKLGIRENGYYEYHHILPKSLFPLWANKPSNKVPLTAREHFFCHQLLVKIYPGRPMVFALYLMAFGNEKGLHSEKYKITSKEYETIKKLNSEARKGQIPWNKGKKASEVSIEKMKESRQSTINNMTKEERKEKFGHHQYFGKNNPFYGKKHSLETKNKISKTKKERNKLLSKEERQKKYSRDLRGAKNGRARKVKLLNTGEIFETISQAKYKYPQATNISSCCSGKLLHSGKLNGENMRWEYVN